MSSAGPPEWRDLLARVTSASLTDAVKKKHGASHRAHVIDLVTPTPDRVLFGQAVTMAFVPKRADVHDTAGANNYARMFYEAVGGNGAGKVLVMTSHGRTAETLAGGTKVSRLQSNGLAGLLADGRLRDFHEIREYDFITYCRGETVIGGGVMVPHAVNVPVVFDAVTIMPGDSVYADRAGLVIIPETDVVEILRSAAAIEADDAELIRQVSKEDPAEVRLHGARK